MDQATQQRLTRQLARWARTAISQGRFPFRKVETFPPLITEGGELRPDLVFWINRDSFMAGGVLLFPQEEEADRVEAGRFCASALGLRHFVTWTVQEIAFWGDRKGAVSLYKTMPLKNFGNTEGERLRNSLNTVMEELKILSVLGAVAPAELPPHYLANLCRSTLQSSYPFLVETYHMAQGENRLDENAPFAEDLAYQKNALTLLRLLGLIFHDRLPPAVQPENLERAMRFALDTLQASLQEVLKIAENELPLPFESAVRFHHLFRRLTQLRCGKDRHRAAQVLEILLEYESSNLGGFPLPFDNGEEAKVALLIHPDRLYQENGEPVEISSAPIQALTSLLRELKGLPPAQAQTTELFSLTLPHPPAIIRGTLTDQRIPDTRQRKTLTALLRTSWPTRRFPFHPHSPRWLWEFLHVLGLAAEQACIELSLPDSWLTADYGIPLSKLLKEEFTFDCLARSPRGGLRLRLIKAAKLEGVTNVMGPTGPRQISWLKIREGHRCLLPLALDLPDDIFSLMDKGFFQIPAVHDWPASEEREIFLFSRSSLGRFLWKIVTGGQALPRQTALKDKFLRRGFPLPAAEILENFRLFAWEEGKKIPPQAALDSELARWLGEKNLKLPHYPAKTKMRWPAPPFSEKMPIDNKLPAQITNAVFADGLPRFPEQYLYDYFRPELQEFIVDEPLKLGEEFLGIFEIYDSKGNTLKVEGEETARALVLASYSNQGLIRLPKNRQLTATLLGRYLNDLKNLRRSLWRETYAKQPNPRSANQLAEKIWDSLPLPPGKFFEK